MIASKRWTVDVHIDEHEGRTRALARLHHHDGTSLVGLGLDRLNPADRDVPEIGDELAVARALSDLVTSFWTPQQAISNKLPTSRCT